MKTILGIAYNFFKTISSEKDSNQVLYAEANFIFSEPKYEISNANSISKSRIIGELECLLTLDTAKKIRDSMDEIINFLESQET
jgi:hypothetical protein